MLETLIDMDVVYADFAGAKICRYDPTDLFRIINNRSGILPGERGSSEFNRIYQ